MHPGQPPPGQPPMGMGAMAGKGGPMMGMPAEAMGMGAMAGKGGPVMGMGQPMMQGDAAPTPWTPDGSGYVAAAAAAASNRYSPYQPTAVYETVNPMTGTENFEKPQGYAALSGNMSRLKPVLPGTVPVGIYPPRDYGSTGPSLSTMVGANDGTDKGNSLAQPCKYADNCKRPGCWFSHPCGTAPAGPAAAGQNFTPFRARDVLGAEICQNFKRGTCVRGTGCKFSHGEAVPPVPGTQTMLKSDKPCQDFRRGACNRPAGGCKFSHDLSGGAIPALDAMAGFHMMMGGATDGSSAGLLTHVGTGL